MKHSLYISPIFSLGIVAPLRHVLTRGNCQLNYGQKHLKCPSEHGTPNDLIRGIGAFRDFGLTRFRPVMVAARAWQTPFQLCEPLCPAQKSRAPGLVVAFKNDVPSRSAGDRARAELRLDAAGDPGFEKNSMNPNFIRINSSGDHNDRLQEFTWTIGRHHRGGQGVFAAQWCLADHPTSGWLRSEQLVPCQQVNEAYQQVAFADKVHCSLFRIEKA